ncbi:MAG: flagellar hook-basal body complex protein FliE [Methanomicrobiales archaeon]|nr:flagellar hook-basal body complex protein FliE [Methanomicrobiales archaeon]
MKVIGIVGLPASGKGEFSRIASELHIPVIVMGDIIRAEVIRRCLPQSDAYTGHVANELRRAEGMDAIARRTIPYLADLSGPLAIIDGIRGDAEVALFRRHFPEFILVGIHSSIAFRAQRLEKRGRADDPKAVNELSRRDERERAWGLDTALASADITLENEGTLEDFAREVRILLTRLGDEP